MTTISSILEQFDKKFGLRKYNDEPLVDRDVIPTFETYGEIRQFLAQSLIDFAKGCVPEKEKPNYSYVNVPEENYFENAQIDGFNDCRTETLANIERNGKV